MTINPEVLSNVIEAVLAQTGHSQRWLNAVNRGALLIEEERCLPTEDGALLIFSDSGAEYRTTEKDCRTGNEPCKAWSLGQPCKHVAAFRLMALIEEAQAASDASTTSH